MWADTVIRKGVSERLQEWLGDGATDALVEIAAQPVMEYWRKKIQPIIFSGNEVEIDFSVPLATGMTYEISQYVAPDLMWSNTYLCLRIMQFVCLRVSRVYSTTWLLCFFLLSVSLLLQ